MTYLTRVAILLPDHSLLIPENSKIVVDKNIGLYICPKGQKYFFDVNKKELQPE